MSLNMYIGEVQAQTKSMNAFCIATIQGMEKAIGSIDVFAGDVMLQGKTYDSAKIFFVQTYRQLAQGIIYLCEELIRQNDAFPSDFQSEVASVDVIEHEILDQIQEINRTIASMEAISENMPGMVAMLQIYPAMKRKLEEKLEHLYQFNESSSDNYSTALQLAASIAKGLSEVQSGKGFQAVSGTFSTQSLNMDWAKPIQVITEEKMRKAEEERIKDESLLDKFKDGVEDGVEAMDQASEKIIHTVENISTIYHNYKEGQREAVIDGLKGLVNTVLHPIDSFESAIYALSHLKETFNAVKQAISDSWNQEVVNGDWNSRAKWFGNVSVQATLAVVGTKGVDKISKISKVSKVDEPSKINESVNFIQSVKNVINSDKYRQFIDKFNNIFMPKNEFALAGTSGFDLSSFDYPTFNEAKNTFLFFDKFKSHPNSIYKNNGTVEHIFHGNINKKGESGGYHHVSMMGEGEILKITKQPNKYGVYEAKVTVNGVVKVPTSTFFPDEWSRVEVLKAIETAYNNRLYTGVGNRYIGTTSEGMKIMLFIDKSTDRVISAFPIY